VGSKAEQAFEKRAYAKEQGAVARRLKSGEGVLFYRIEVVNGREVRKACPGEQLAPEERQRQINEAVRNAEKARAEANREAKALESE
jgi:hypothetical protein